MNKFYTAMYNEPARPTPGAAIRLWSDWNSQIHDWATSAGRGQPGFKYMSLRIEDIMSSDMDVRFAAIQSLAHWLESGHHHDAVCQSVFLLT